MPPFGPIVLLPAPHVVSGSFHHQIDDRGQRLIQAVVRDHRYVVAERLALDVFLHSSDVGETLDVSLERPGGCVCGSDREVAAMQVFVVDSYNNRNGQNSSLESLKVEESRDNVRALDHDAGPFHGRPLDQGAAGASTAAVCSLNPTITRSRGRGGGSRS